MDGTGVFPVAAAELAGVVQANGCVARERGFDAELGQCGIARDGSAGHGEGLAAIEVSIHLSDIEFDK